MDAAFAGVSAALRPVLARYGKRLRVQADGPHGYSLESNLPSPFPQHKGNPLFFGAVRTGKAYVSYHLMPLYMCPTLMERISPELKRRMQGKSCFNFKAVPSAEIIEELKNLTSAAFEQWRAKKWI
jgi:hypothetical protein